MLHFETIYTSFPYIAGGITVTLKFAVVSLLCGLPLGVILAIGKLSNILVLEKLSAAYTAVFRGTPLLVQLGIIFHAMPQVIGCSISAFQAGILAFSLNSAAYSSEIIRAGIQGIDPGQWDAAKVLGISTLQTWIKVILPQAVRNILPALVNEMVNLLKESALVATIGEADLLKRAQNVAGEKFSYFEPLMIAASCYFVMVMIISFMANRLEKRWAHA
ncbi:amino acid ABC transporter permease [Candidatus Finniella inopinata]|uniref:Putative glutamine transport system permease protein GlnP n=1 Tax=Candidatus Finniella inopinata TaxID=1696036 RepID=A0A4Q7DGY5_9PROT|nr:amino acid ABC transporter permease [Candidatus Finniella inopinata]RZI45359.1 amino acid ABC transporter permease [Candidatus Finniella inopinata]